MQSVWFGKRVQRQAKIAQLTLQMSGVLPTFKHNYMVIKPFTLTVIYKRSL